MKSALKVRWARQRGQTSVEYILILALLVGVVAMFGGKFKEKIGTVTDDLFGNVGSSVNNLSK